MDCYILRVRHRPWTRYDKMQKLHSGRQDLHPYDIHLFWADVRERVKQQVFAESSCPAAGTTLSKNRCFKSQVTSFLSRSK